MYELKERIRKLVGNSIKTYRVKLDKDEETIHGLDKFADMVVEDISALMKKEWMEYSLLTPHEKIAHSQWSIVEQKEVQAAPYEYTKQNSERIIQVGAHENVVDEIISQLSTNSTPIVIRGLTGSGKSTMLSRISWKLREYGTDVVPIFCGSRTELSNALDVLQYMVYELEVRLALPHIADDMADTKSRDEKAKEISVDTWRERLNSLVYDYSGKTLVFVLDALDQLFADELRDKHVFLPYLEKDNVKIIMSCLDDYLLEKTTAFRFCEIWIEPLAGNQISIAVNGILNSLGRQLEPRVIDEIVKIPAAQNPLYLSLLIQRLAMMDRRDFDDINAHGGKMKDISNHQIEVIHTLSDTVEGICFDIINETTKRIGGEFVRLAVEYIALSRNGLRESDLEKILLKTKIDWNSLDFSLFMNYLNGFFLNRDDGRINFTHRTIREGIVAGCKNAKTKHQNIREHLHMLNWNDPVSLDEMVLQCYLADDKRYFVGYIEDIVKKDFYDGIHSAAKVVHDFVINHGRSWLEDILQNPDEWKWSDSFMKFLTIYLRPRFMHLSDEYNDIIEILQLAMIKYTDLMDVESVEELSLLGESHYYLGSCLYELGNDALAEQHYAEAVSAFQKVGVRDVVKSEKLLASVYNVYGLLFDKKGLYSHAAHYFDQALAIREKHEGLSQAVAVSYHNVSCNCFNVGNVEKAIKYEKKAIDIIEKCFLENAVDCSKNIMLFYGKMAMIYRSMGQKQDSIRYIEKALDVGIRYVADIPEIIEPILAIIYNDKGLILSDEENSENSIECYKKAIAIQERWSKKLPEKFLGELSNTLCNLAKVYENNSNTYVLSEETYIRGIDLKEKLYFNNQNSWGMSLAISYNNLGCLYCKCKRYGDARHYFLLAISLADKYGFGSGMEHKNSIIQFFKNAAYAYQCLLMPFKAKRYRKYAQQIETYEKEEELQQFHGGRMKHLANRIRTNSDNSSHLFIKFGICFNILFLIQLVFGTKEPSILFTSILIQYVIGIFVGVALGRECCLNSKQKKILWLGWYLSAGLVTGWYANNCINKSRNVRQCGTYLQKKKSSVINVTRKTKGGDEEQYLQERIRILEQQNMRLNDALLLVKEPKFVRKRIILLTVGLCISSKMWEIGIQYLLDITPYKLLDTHQRIFAVLFFLNLWVVIAVIKNTVPVEGKKKKLLIVLSIFSLGIFTSIASLILYHKETNGKRFFLPLYIFLAVYTPILIPVFMWPYSKKKNKYISKNPMEIEISNNRETISHYRLELMKLNASERMNPAMKA